jgi:hypothetical protein
MDMSGGTAAKMAFSSPTAPSAISGMAEDENEEGSTLCSAFATKAA